MAPTEDDPRENEAAAEAAAHGPEGAPPAGPEESAPRVGRKPGGTIVMAVFNASVLIFLVVAAVFVFKHRGAEKPQEVASVPPEISEREGFTTITLFFGDADAFGLIPETREITVEEGGFEARVRQVIAELAHGPQGQAMPVLPEGTEVLRLFRDFDGTLFLDMNAAFRDRHWGGAAGELLTLNALRQTVAANFAEVRGLQLLVEGEVVESIAGHVVADHPIPVER